MNNQIKKRLYITTVSISLIWLLCTCVINLMQVNEIRSLALTECYKDDLKLYDYCYNKTNKEIQLTIFNYISPFLPAVILLWIDWVFKFNFQIDIQVVSYRFRKITNYFVYFVAFLGFICPFYIVYEKEVDRLYTINFSDLFLLPWLALCWISIPIFFQKLLDSEKNIVEFSNLYRVLYVVASSPILSFISILLRLALNN